MAAKQYKACSLKIKAIEAKVKNLRDLGLASLAGDTKKTKLFQVMFRQLDSWIKDYEHQTDSIALIDPKPAEFQESEFNKMLTDFEDLVAEIRLTQEEISPGGDTVSATESASRDNIPVRLPKLSIPTFSGDVSEWMSFFALFNSLVGEHATLSNVERLQYLRVSLQGEPLDLIKGLSLIGENYPIAIRLLQDRYANIRRVATMHMDQLINLPVSQIASPQHMRELVASYRENIEALRVLKVVSQDMGNTTDGFLLFLILSRKLDPVTRCNFERSITSNKEIPTPEQLISFVESECHALEAAQEMSRLTGNGEVGTSTLFVQTSEKCTVCQGPGHRLFQCNSYLRKSVAQRRRIVMDNRLCFNCLSAHLVEACPSASRCRICREKHHSTIHVGKSNTAGVRTGGAQERGMEGSDVPGDAGEIQTFATNTVKKTTQVILSTVLVGIQNADGKCELVRALLDTGSQASYLTTRCMQRLRLPAVKTNLKVSGIAQYNVNTRGMVTLHLHGRSGGPLIMSTDALVLDKITGALPTTPLPVEWNPCLSGMYLADPGFREPQPIDCLLGADVFARILSGGQKDLGPNRPTALNTAFGWIIMGAFNSGLRESQNVVLTGHTSVIPAIDEVLRRFWEVEEASDLGRYSKEDSECETHYMTNHSREDDGRYVVRLPFKNTDQVLGSSFKLAESRFMALERRLVRDHKTYDMYREFMAEYVSSGHMEPCDWSVVEGEGSKHYFMPHHGVIKPTSSTTKLRVVFDASAKTASKSRCSLNDLLQSGPKLQNDIAEILLRFRAYPVVFTSDIKQMFRGVWVHPDDRNYQLILWRDSPDKELGVYRLKTVTFGVTCSPYLAMRSLLQLTQDEGGTYREASLVLQDDVFVDDIVTGAFTIDSAREVQRQLIELLSKAGFQLRKWTSNKRELLESVPQEALETPVSFSPPDSPLFGVLGLGWNSVSDSFVFATEERDYPSSKRGVLSCIARIYDPLGLLTPVTFWAKCMLQMLWVRGIGWDAPLVEDLAEKWRTFVSELGELSHMTIPRYFSSRKGELHGFCDASEKGYAAVVYLLSDIEDGSKKLTLIMAKSKVAPLKQISVPRLELCGAHLLAKIMKYCVDALGGVLHLGRSTAWTDSTVVLSWIRAPSYLLKTFVANRVSEIQTWFPSDIWRHIATDVNPADRASRGMYPRHLVDSGWFEGPSFLLQDREAWLMEAQPLCELEELPERKTSPLELLVSTRLIPEISFMERISSWTKLLRVMAWVLRFVNNSRCPEKRRSGPFSCSEIRIARMGVLKLVQAKCFESEISSLEKNEACLGRIQRLSPFMDEAGLVRVGGRLSQAEISYSSKHPILLPRDHHVTNLLVDYYHRASMHGGPRLLQSLLSRQFWVLSCRAVVRKHIYRCITCFRHKPRNQPPEMSDLPAHRVRPARPFSSVSLDFAGPFVAKPHKRSKARCKMYLCLFICTATKAAHLEAISDMTTAAFLAALQRFVSRRGLCQNIYSDQGTNLVGAAAELRKAVKLLQSPSNAEILERATVDQGITWHFQPPAAPHFGGLHEAAVKQAKHHLGRVIGTQILTYEELQTLFAQVEAILNSRPLCPVSSDPREVDVLTPAHFLIGEQLIALPDARLNPTKLGTRWSLVQTMRRHFWDRWQKEYLHTIIERTKWYQSTKSVKVGAVVLVQEDRLPPLHWKLARITEVVPGKDGIVRVVHLATADGKLTRPAVKVFPLPLE